ncbi:MAG: hypothetical protein RLZZ399_1516 [Verrucomicrobiota bacterium]
MWGIPRQKIPGRLTGTARHLSDAAHKLVYATIEESLQEVRVYTLDVRSFTRDGNNFTPGKTDAFSSTPSKLPGYHGKGLRSRKGRIMYASKGGAGYARGTDHPRRVSASRSRRHVGSARGVQATLVTAQERRGFGSKRRP